jgi:hypothetical protein
MCIALVLKGFMKQYGQSAENYMPKRRFRAVCHSFIKKYAKKYGQGAENHMPK